MKRTILATILVLALVISMSSVLAVEPGYTYEAAKLVNPVTFDGVAAVGEWDDANALIVNADNETFKKYGRWQGGAAPKTAAELSITYKMKWDDKNLYILEERTDPSYFVPTGGATQPWTGDGTLFFLAYDNGDTKWANVYEPFWLTKDTDGKAKVALRSYLSGSFAAEDTADRIGNWKYAGASNGNVYTLEIAIPWTDIATVGAIPAIAEGLKFWFTPIISNSDADYANWDQLNFHDRFANGDAIEDEAGATELPKNWAGLKLTAAIVTPEAPTDENPEAPQTSDSAMVMVIVMLAAAAAFVFAKKATVK